MQELSEIPFFLYATSQQFIIYYQGQNMYQRRKNVICKVKITIVELVEIGYPFFVDRLELFMLFYSSVL